MTTANKFTSGSITTKLAVPPTSRPAGTAPAGPPVQSDAWNQRIDELLRMRQMQDDWDGLGAPAPLTALVDSALFLAQALRQNSDNSVEIEPPCRVVAGLTGTVLFEWQDCDGGYTELEVTHPRRAEWVQIIPGQPTKSEVIVW